MTVTELRDALTKEIESGAGELPVHLRIYEDHEPLVSVSLEREDGFTFCALADE